MSKKVVGGFETAGQMRRFLGNVALSAAQGDMDIRAAAVAIKACEQINASLYSEAKIAALLVTVGQQPQALGQLRINDENVITSVAA